MTAALRHALAAMQESGGCYLLENGLVSCQQSRTLIKPGTFKALMQGHYVFSMDGLFYRLTEKGKRALERVE